MLMTIARRRCLGVTAAVALLSLPLTGARAQAGGAAQFVRTLGGQLVDVVNEPGAPGSKRSELQPILDRNIAVDQIALFCLGRYLQDASPAQKQQYVSLFHSVLLNSILGHLGGYRGVRFAVGGSTRQPDGEHVQTTIYRPNEEPASVDWVIDNVDGSRKVIDVVAEGTSLRTTQRGDYLAYLDRHGGSVGALIAALQRQIARENAP
jgi:phospholipid transport system substrate-binding protein